MDFSRILENWYLWASVAVAFLSIIVGAARFRKTPGFALFLAVIASAGFAYWVWREKGGLVFFSILAFGYAYQWIGTRWNVWVREKYKFARPLYWLIYDTAPITALLYGVNRWPKSWVFYVVWIVASIIYLGIMLNVLMAIFPIVGRQEYLRALTPNNPQRPALEQELARREREKLRKRSLRQLKKHTALYNAALKDFERGRLAEAEKRLTPVLSILEKVSPLSLEQKTLLGRIYLLRAKILISSKYFSQAEVFVRKARGANVQPDLSILSALAENAARTNNRQGDNLSYCIEFLQMRRGQGGDATVNLVSDFLRGCCSFNETSAVSAVSAAQTLAEKVKTAEPALAWPYGVIGAGNELKGQHSEAISPLEQALERDPSQWEPHYYLGRAHYNLKNTAASYQHLSKSLALKLDQPTNGAHLLGNLLLEANLTGSSLSGDHSGDLEKSILWLQQAVKQNDKNVEAHYDLARAYHCKSDDQKARKSLESALKIDSKHIPAHRMLADLMFDAADWPNAHAHYQQVLLVQPRDPVVNIKDGRCLVETGQYEEALAQLQPYEKENTHAALLVGRSYLRLHQYENARERLAGVAHADGLSAEASYYLGCSLAWLGRQGDPGQYKQALKQFEQVAEMDEPVFAKKALLQLGHLYLTLDRPEDALKSYRKVYSSRDLKLDAGLGIVRAYLVQGREDEALQVLKDLTTSHGGDRQVYMLQGLVYERQGKIHEAEEAYQKANATGALGIILFLQGDTRRAAQLCKKARKEGYDSDRLLYFSGLTAAAEGDYAAAIAEWEILSSRHPEDVHVRLNIARAWYLSGCEAYKRGDLKQTAEAWEKFYKVYHVDDQTRENLGNIYLIMAGQMLGKSDAEDAVKRARELHLDPKICDFIEGLSQVIAGDAKGVTTLRKVVEQQPENAQALYNLGVAEMRTGDCQEAISHLLKAQGCAEGDLLEQVRWALAAAYGCQSNWAFAASIVMEPALG